MLRPRGEAHGYKEDLSLGIFIAQEVAVAQGGILKPGLKLGHRFVSLSTQFDTLPSFERKTGTIVKKSAPKIDTI